MAISKLVLQEVDGTLVILPLTFIKDWAFPGRDHQEGISVSYVSWVHESCSNFVLKVFYSNFFHSNLLSHTVQTSEYELEIAGPIEAVNVPAQPLASVKWNPDLIRVKSDRYKTTRSLKLSNFSFQFCIKLRQPTFYPGMGNIFKFFPIRQIL